MIAVDIPGAEPLRLEHVVLDFNGTLACDGRLHDGVRERLASLASLATIHVVTADTFGTAQDALAGMDLVLHLLPPGKQSVAKKDYVRNCGAAKVAAVGNGRNDAAMLEVAALSIAVLGDEGAYGPAVRAARIVARDIGVALDLLRDRRRLVATLRD